jgi:hypothetical protein
VQIREPIDISLVTRLANISEAEFNALNPAYNRYVIKVMSEPRTLLLPRDNKEIFLKNLETYQDPKFHGSSIGLRKMRIFMRLQPVWNHCQAIASH